MSYIGDWKDYFKNRDSVHQIGFYSPDWKHFALKHHELFGSGSFYYTTNTFGRLIYRGKEVDAGSLKFHAAYGAWGSHTVEVVQQEPLDTPTMFTDGNHWGYGSGNPVFGFGCGKLGNRTLPGH